MARTMKSNGKRGKKPARKTSRKTARKPVAVKAAKKRAAARRSLAKSASTPKSAAKSTAKRPAGPRRTARVSVKSRSAKNVLPKAIESVKRLARKAERRIESAMSTH